MWWNYFTRKKKEGSSWTFFPTQNILSPPKQHCNLGQIAPCVVSFAELSIGFAEVHSFTKDFTFKSAVTG